MTEPVPLEMPDAKNRRASYRRAPFLSDEAAKDAREWLENERRGAHAHVAYDGEDTPDGDRRGEAFLCGFTTHALATAAPEFYRDSRMLDRQIRHHTTAPVTEPTGWSPPA